MECPIFCDALWGDTSLCLLYFQVLAQWYITLHVPQTSTVGAISKMTSQTKEGLHVPSGSDVTQKHPLLTIQLSIQPLRWWWSNVASSPYIKTDGLEDTDDMRLLLKINDIYFLCAKPDIRIDEPIFSLFIVLPSIQSFLSTNFLPVSAFMAFTLSHASHLCVRVWVCVCLSEWVFYKHTHTHTHTHTLFTNHSTCYVTHCALKRVYIR